MMGVPWSVVAVILALAASITVAVWSCLRGLNEVTQDD